VCSSQLKILASFLNKEMTYGYNSKAHYAPYGKHEELITRKDLTQLNIIVQDDGQISNGFDVKLQFLISRFTNVSSKAIFIKRMKDIQLQRLRITLRTTL